MQRSRKRLAVTLFLLFFTSSLFSQSDSSKIDTIKTVNVGIEQAGVIYDANGAIMKHVMTQNEFKKAACCTLSESFELSNTVEISNADGVSGIRQIEMMGLNGKYALLTRDNIPQMGSLALLNGLNNIPGPMVSDVRLAKGIGSVTLGYEGITGGIDYGLKTNENGPKLELNAYQNNQGRTEFNLFHKKSFKNNVHHFSYLHLGSQYITTDMNMDMYADMPLTNRIFAGNHLSFHKKKIEGQFGVSFWNEQKKNGQVSHTNTSELSKLPNTFKFNQNESKLDVFGKMFHPQ